MPHHLEVPGCAYYITIVVYRRLRVFTRPAYILPLLDSFNFYRYKHNFHLIGYVVMPDHMHCLIWPHKEDRLGDIMRDFKKFTATRIIRQAEVEANQHLLDWFAAAGTVTGRCDNKVWQDDYWDKVVYSSVFVRQKLKYMHRNPLSIGLVDEPGAYAYSSYRNYVNGDESLIEIDRSWME